MVSQPLVAGTVAGLVVGDVGLGLRMGAALQLVWIAVLPVGAAAFPDGATASVVGVGMAWLLGRDGMGAGWAAAAGILAALLAGHVGQRLVGVLRRLNTRLEEAAIADAQLGSGGGVARAVATATLLRVLTGASVAAVFLAVEPLVALGLAALPRAGAFPLYVWAAPVAVGTMAALTRRIAERWLMLAGLGVGLVVLLVSRGGA